MEQWTVFMFTTCFHVHPGDIDVLEPILLSYKKYHLVQQAQTNDVAYLGESPRTYNIVRVNIQLCT